MAASTRTSHLHVALLRGINVGGKHKLPMTQLVALFEAEGCTRVETLIQSGNVVFAATAKLAATLPRSLPRALQAHCGFDVPVVLRTAAEFRAAAAEHPLAAKDVDAKSLHVAFLRDPPTAAARAKLDPDRSPGDAFVVKGREVYLALGNGVAKTKLTNAWLDRELDTVSTLRNWATIGKLVDMLDDA